MTSSAPRSTPVLLLAALLAGCARAPVPASAPGASPHRPGAVVAQRPETPLAVSWIVTGSEEHAVRLLARVDRRAPLAIPVKVAVQVPASATLTGGPASYVIAASDAAGVTDTAFTVSFAAVPAEDLLLTADAVGEGFGVHAVDAFRFGRAPPEPGAPAATGQHLELNGHDYGAAVPLSR